jgi:hypothetical protein
MLSLNLKDMRNQISILLLVIMPIFAFGQTVTYDFEAGDLSAWSQFPANRWEISTSNPLGGSRSLKHITYSPVSGPTYVDAISTPLPIWNGTEGSIKWRFKLRHRVNPSASNHWAVFLSSNNSADDMISSSSLNGYAVGVNLTGSDDILRLYRITNGTFTSIITSSINWENDIRSLLTSIGAIEIERKPDGTFILKVATTGSFNDLTNQGTTVDNTYNFGGHFGVYFSYTSANSGNLMVDDISFEYTPKNTNTPDAIIVNPTTQIEGGTIRSSDITETPIDFFRFSIQDLGDAPDGLPTRITKLRFLRANTTNPVNWNQVIKSVTLSSGGTTIPIVSTSILANEIVIYVDKDNMVINNATAKDFLLSLTLNANNFVDGATLQAQIPSSNHGWETHHTGSDLFSTFPQTVSSNIFALQVVPAQLVFVVYPQLVLANNPFRIVAHATDALGNHVTSYNASEVVLDLIQGTGSLSPLAALTTSMSNGIAEWPAISYSGTDIFRLRASTVDLAPANGGNITVIDKSIVSNPSQQPTGKPISSNFTTPGQSVEVIRFNISDEGIDELPTIVRQINLKRPTGVNMASFSGNIGGVVVTVNGEVLSIGNPNIVTASITIPIPKGVLIVPEGETVEVSVSVHLRTTGLADGTNLRFLIDTESHGFTADTEGSAFATSFPSQVLSNNFTVDVAATRLTFSSVPSNVGLNSSFSIETSAVDANGNLDIDAVGLVTLSKNSGTGTLTIPSPQSSLSGGKANWTGLSYNTAQPFTILASTPALNDVVSGLIYCSDRTSNLQLPTNALQSGQISTLATTSSQAVEVFRARIADLGTTDGLPTYVTQLVFRSFGLPTDAQLNKIIAGVILKANGANVPIISSTITSNTITLTVQEGNLVINDNDAVDFSLSVFLKAKGQTDGSTINLHIPATGHGWLTSPIGSGFATTFGVGVVGPVFHINAVATNLSFIEQPFFASPENPITLIVATSDIYGNIDKMFDGMATLSLEFGPDQFTTSELTKPFVNGLATWNDIILPTGGRYRFKANATIGGPVEAFSETIWNGEGVSCAINENFDSGYPVSFPSTSHWEASTVSPIDGTRSLKHSLSGVGGESQLPIQLNIESLADNPIEWSFAMRNGNWDPSSDNTFWFVLSSNSQSIKLGEFSGYVVGVNFTGTSDLVSLWRVTVGQTPTPIITSTFDWDESETVGIKVTRAPNGEWALWIQSAFNQTEYILAGKVFDTRHSKALSCGPVFKYSSTRAGEFWLDNLKVCSTTYPPIIKSANMRTFTSIDVEFSAFVNQSDASVTSNYKLKDANGNSLAILDAFPNSENYAKVTLRTETLPLESMMLTVMNIRSADGTKTVKDSLLVGIGTPGTFGNVIINEIMARPSLVTPLPNVEYIELHNRTSGSVTLTGWRVRGNNSYATIPTATIEPNGYIILTSTTNAATMSAYGNTIGVPSFPTLLVGGMFIGLYDNFNNLISWTEYTDNWYRSDLKKAGGYSLERIDPNNLVEGQRNWSGSNDPSGGTPGRQNSNFAYNPDNINPKVTEIKVLSNNRIEVGFSEPMDSLSITSTNYYSINKGIGSPIMVSSWGPKYNRVELLLGNNLMSREIYDICFSEYITDFAGNSLETNCKHLALPETASKDDIVINEILFNPYTGGVDFVELYNNSEKSIDLNKIRIANRNRTTLEINENYIASDSAWIILPRSYAVLSDNPSFVSQFYYVESPDLMVWTRRMPAYPNDNGYVVLFNEFNEIIDEFPYNEKMHNPLISNAKGVSLERINPNLPTKDASSWQSAAQTSGYATPTAKNSQFTDAIEGKDFFSLSSQIFSPDNDGFEDILLINYELPESGYIANIMIFDSRGRRVKRLAANIPLGTTGSIKWDGTDDANRSVSLGAYVIFIEAFDLRGNIKKYKKTVVVATRLRN